MIARFFLSWIWILFLLVDQNNITKKNVSAAEAIHRNVMFRESHSLLMKHGNEEGGLHDNL
jgi:hypothetical protein